MMDISSTPNTLRLASPRPWKSILLSNFTSWHKFADFLELSEANRTTFEQSPSFPLNVPFRLAQKIAKNDLNDPILKQFLPTTQERQRAPEFVDDPTQDISFQRDERLLHKYHGRALMIATGACAMHCRYCFRQNYDYPTNNHSLDRSLEIVANDPSIQELILSGGDPLSLMDQQLEHLFHKISQIPHIKRIRIHTRFPVGIPERIDEPFLKILEESKPQVWFITHINHPRELDEDVIKALKSITRLGIPVLNQSVLLQGVNDDLETLQMLSERLVDNGLLPYYLHQLDRVSGTMHFEVCESKGQELLEGLKSTLSGYAVPKYVKEIAGDKYKRNVSIP